MRQIRWQDHSNGVAVEHRVLMAPVAVDHDAIVIPASKAAFVKPRRNECLVKCPFCSGVSATTGSSDWRTATNLAKELSPAESAEIRTSSFWHLAVLPLHLRKRPGQ